MEPTWPADPQVTERAPYPVSRKIGLTAGLVVCFVVLLLPAPEGLGLAGWRTVAVGALMAIWWISEAIPISATALVPLVAFPILGIASIGETASPYANPLIFLFLAGFLIAIAMQRWGLHRRLALRIISLIGTSPRHIVAGFLISSAALSMWVSNTATAVMMLPIGMSVALLSRRDPGATRSIAESNFEVALMLSIAYGATIGGLATIIGTPPNALMAAYLNETFNYDIGFARWMLVGVPLVLVALPICYAVLTRIAFPIRMKELPGGGELIRDALEKLGKMNRGERLTSIVFAVVVVLWVSRPLYASAVPGISDTGIGMAGALLLFLLPVDLEKSEFVLSWDAAEELPWGVLLLFGGGLSLAAAINATGLAAWIGGAFAGISTWPVIFIVVAVVVVVLFLTELTSNLATAAAFLPIMASVAIGIGQSPLLLVIPAALAASGAFMLPVATPPNAIAYGSGFLRIGHMTRAGLLLNLLFVALITGVMYLIAINVFDITLGSNAGWMMSPGIAE